MGNILNYLEGRLGRCDARIDDLEAQVTKQEIELRMMLFDVYKQLESLCQKLDDIGFVTQTEQKNIAQEAVYSLNLVEGSSDAKADAEAVAKIVVNIRKVNAANVYKYLTVDDCANMRQLVSIAKTCAIGIMSDKALSFDDVPKVVRMILDVIKCVNAHHAVSDSNVALTSGDVANLVKAIIMSFLQIVLPATQYDTMIAIIDSQFQMLQLTALPVLKNKFGCPWFKFI
ncbi:hypothetical protein JKP88DRAFT_287030 [Tribonema minus]|uniref:Uncharacterized protein n=1 Tax=Tribonema minus TaxID=303371 RepID=A0A835ZEK0_9STRA|nr:hypothetical protein JKP88DRAFT_287030 [Tribonema minus]